MSLNDLGLLPRSKLRLPLESERSRERQVRRRLRRRRVRAGRLQTAAARLIGDVGVRPHREAAGRQDRRELGFPASERQQYEGRLRRRCPANQQRLLLIAQFAGPTFEKPHFFTWYFRRNDFVNQH